MSKILFNTSTLNEIAKDGLLEKIFIEINQEQSIFKFKIKNELGLFGIKKNKRKMSDKTVEKTFTSLGAFPFAINLMKKNKLFGGKCDLITYFIE